MTITIIFLHKGHTHFGASHYSYSMGAHPVTDVWYDSNYTHTFMVFKITNKVEVCEYKMRNCTYNRVYLSPLLYYQLLRERHITSYQE